MKYFRFSAGWSLFETRQMFRRAAVVVGVNDQYFSNLIFCKPETHVIEISCTTQELTSFTNTFSSYVLGLKYHGIMNNVPCSALAVDVYAVKAIVQYVIGPPLNKKT